MLYDKWFILYGQTPIRKIYVIFGKIFFASLKNNPEIPQVKFIK